MVSRPILDLNFLFTLSDLKVPVALPVPSLLTGMCKGILLEQMFERVWAGKEWGVVCSTREMVGMSMFVK